MLEFSPPQSRLVRSSQDDGSHHQHLWTIHHVVMIVFCITRQRERGLVTVTPDPVAMSWLIGIRWDDVNTPLFSAIHFRSPVNRYPVVGPPYNVLLLSQWIGQETQFWLLALSQFQFVSSVSLVIRHCTPFETSWFFTTRVPAGLFQVIWLLDGWGSKTYCCGGHLSILPNLLLFPYIMPDSSMPATGPSCRLKLL